MHRQALIRWLMWKKPVEAGRSLLKQFGNLNHHLGEPLIHDLLIHLDGTPEASLLAFVG